MTDGTTRQSVEIARRARNVASQHDGPRSDRPPHLDIDVARHDGDCRDAQLRRQMRRPVVAIRVPDRISVALRLAVQANADPLCRAAQRGQGEQCLMVR